MSDRPEQPPRSDGGEKPPDDDDGERPPRVMMLILVLFPFLLMLVIGLFYGWIRR